MQSAPNEACSDLELARAASQRLRGRPAGESSDAPPFSVAQARPCERAVERPEPAAAVAVSTALWETGNLGSRFWNDLLLECVEACGVDTLGAFAVDARGLSIAHVGDLDPVAVEGTGSRLVVALEQAGRMELFESARVRAVRVELDDRSLTGLMIGTSEGSNVIVGLVGAAPLAEPARALVESLLQEALLRG